MIRLFLFSSVREYAPTFDSPSSLYDSEDNLFFVYPGLHQLQPKSNYLRLHFMLINYGQLTACGKLLRLCWDITNRPYTELMISVQYQLTFERGWKCIDLKIIEQIVNWKTDQRRTPSVYYVYQEETAVD